MSPLTLHQAGHWSDLAALDNPGGLVLVPVPSFREVMVLVAKDGETLTEPAFDAARGRAVAIALTEPEAADYLAGRDADIDTYSDYLALQGGSAG